MFRSKFTDDERIGIAISVLNEESIGSIASRLKCSKHSIYQAQRSAWYKLLIKALKPYIKKVKK